MAEMYDVAESTAYAVLYAVLALFAILAILSAGYGASLLPESIRGLIVAQGEKKGAGAITVADQGGDAKTAVLATDFFLSARNSTGTFGIAMSFFASGMGAWVVYGTTEMGATPRLSWLGVIGYSAASAFPALFIMWLGPMVREASGEEAFCTTDFARKRYGRVMQLSCAAISIFYMFVYLVAELTSISNIYALMINKPTLGENWDNINEGYTTGIAVSIGVITIFYTGIAGLPSSIITDKFQGIMMVVLVLTLTIAVTSNSDNKVTFDEFKVASNWTEDGFYALVTLFIAIMCAELFNQSTWQRVWASKDTPSLRRGFAIGSLLVFLLMMFFGIMGMIAYAKDPVSYDTSMKYAYLSFFDLLLPLGNGWHVVTLVLVTALAASSIDSLQNGMTSILSRDLLKIAEVFDVSADIVKWTSRLALVAINIAAIVMSSFRYSVLSLFLVADLVCATSVFPVFLGLLKPEKYGVLSPTEVGAFLGCISGIVCVLVIGIVIDSDRYLSDPFQYFWLENENEEYICALCGTKTMWTFIITPLVSLGGTIIFTALDVAIRGENARMPIFTALDVAIRGENAGRSIFEIRALDGLEDTKVEELGNEA